MPGADEGRGDGYPGNPGARVVLVVDDDSAVRRVASRALRRAGYLVIEASNGVDALRIVGDHHGKIALLLTDVVMPGMNGRELGEEFQSHHPGVPVLFMSAYAEDEVFLQGVRVARMNFIAKPFTLDELTQAVRDLVRDTP